MVNNCFIYDKIEIKFNERSKTWIKPQITLTIQNQCNKKQTSIDFLNPLMNGITSKWSKLVKGKRKNSQTCV